MFCELTVNGVNDGNFELRKNTYETKAKNSFKTKNNYILIWNVKKRKFWKKVKEKIFKN